MSGLKKAMALALALGMLAVIFNACDRTITRVEQVSAPSNCFECHSDQNTFMVAAEQQWRTSTHASGANIDRNATRYGAQCQVCHTSEGFMAVVAGNPVPDIIPNPTTIHCFTCHAPHTNNDFGVRGAQGRPLADGTTFNIGAGNLCTWCHQARSDVATNTGDGTKISEHYGPHHGPQADVLMGRNGYKFIGYTYFDETSHRVATADGCVDCHIKATSNNLVGGHTFKMRELDPGSSEEDPGDMLNVGACTGCHGGLTNFDYNSVQTTVAALQDSLLTILFDAGLVDDHGHGTGVTTSADSSGAVWNFKLSQEDRSLGVHNSSWIIGLLESAIKYMEGDLPQPTPPMPIAEKRSDGPAVRGAE